MKSQNNNISNLGAKEINKKLKFRQIKSKRVEKLLDKEKNNKKSRFYSHKIEYNEIQNSLIKFLNKSNEKYDVNYYYPETSYPYVWKLTIFGPDNSPYEGKYFNFKLDFNKKFNKITDNITIENKIYHLNFGENGLLLFDIEYNDNKSFYENLFELFDLLYNLFKEPKCELSSKYSKQKIYLYKNRREEYNKKVFELKNE